SGQMNNVDLVVEKLKKVINCYDINLKEAITDKNPFGRMKVKIKREIVTFGIKGLSISDQSGEYVEPNEWNKVMHDKNVVTLDTRNDYEVAIGSFKGAINPNTKNFADFPDWWRKNSEKYKGKSIAMFCTGGIRCEKSTKFLLKEGVRKVYHLKGGILNYLEKYNGSRSQWEGECFVFDQRVSLGPNLEQGSCKLCFACRHPLRPSDLTHQYYEEGVSCHNCFENTDQKRKNSFRERQKQIKLFNQKGEKHLKHF
ncbi:MAG: rhodanese-related sulfurtransferase, partial [Pseudomonadota bacterium]|nr:rhodanese-related sulfurtransferase [Pseudomonadota bacterium]